MRLGYININRINRLVKDRILYNLVLEPMPICESCIEGKMAKRPFPPKGNKSNDLLELVYTNVYGPINIRSHCGYVRIVPSNYYCMLKKLTIFMDISFYISLCMCHEIIV